MFTSARLTASLPLCPPVVAVGVSEPEGSAGRMAALRLKDLAESLLSESKRPSHLQTAT